MGTSATLPVLLAKSAELFLLTLALSAFTAPLLCLGG